MCLCFLPCYPNSIGSKLMDLESNYNGLILQFEYNPETPETIKGWIPGQEEGKKLELLKN